MTFLRLALARIRGFLGGTTGDDAMREEFESHVAMDTAERIRRGVPPDEARRQALVSSGGLTQAAEAVRDQRGLPWLDAIIGEVRYAARALRHSPAFTAVVIVTLALGIGANTAIFSVVRGVLLKPLPHRDGDRLVYLRQSMDGPGGDNLAFSVPEVREYREGAASFAGIAEYSPFSATLRMNDDASRLNVGLVTGNYFEVMGLSPILGRVTGPGDDGAAAVPVMVLTHEFWQRRFQGDPGIVGRHLDVDRKAVTVIGVLEPAPHFPDRVDALLNMVISPHHISAQMVQGRTHRMTQVVGRLTPAATLAEARQEVELVQARQARDYPDAYDAGSHYRVSVIPFRQALGQRAELILRLLMGAAMFVLIIAAANVTNLTLMRGVRREPELVARAALGAGTARLRRLLLVENLGLTLAGAALGTAIAVVGVRMLVSLADRYSPRAGEIRLDGVALGFSLSLAVALAFLLSYVAAVPREGALATLISSGGRRSTGHHARRHLQRGLVVAQVAVSVILLAGAGLLTRTMLQLSRVRNGLVSEQVLTMEVPLLDPATIFLPGADASAKDRYERILHDVRGLPGVIDVGLGSPTPLRRSGVLFDVKAEGRTIPVGQALPRAELRTANPDFFRAAGIPLTAGRAFTLEDRPDAGRVVIINQALADRYFPGEDPVGRRIAWSGDILRFSPITTEWRTIVGVVANTQDGGLDAAPRGVVYMPFTQIVALGGGLVVRAERNVAQLGPAVTSVVRRIVPSALIENVLTVEQIRNQSLSPRRLNAVLVSSFGLLAVLIAAVGIGGVLAFSVSARTSEIGIRMSLGADGARVQRMVLWEGGRLVAIGLVLGVGGALASARLIRGLLFGVPPNDPLTFAMVLGVMAAVGIVACWIPALRASRIDPVAAMR